MEALEGVLETKDSTKMGQERAKSKVLRKLQSGLKPPRRILEALGGVLEVLKALERVLEASWRPHDGRKIEKRAKITVKPLVLKPPGQLNESILGV